MAGSALIIGAAIASAIYLRSIAPPSACLLAHWTGGGQLAPACPDPSAFLEASREFGDKVMIAMLVYPLMAGALLGSSSVAAEIEDGVASVTWPLARSRSRWLFFRLVPFGLVVLACALLVGLATNVLAQEMTPWIDASQSLRDYGLRGPLVPGRAALAFAIAALIGAVLGRSLRAFALALLVAAAFTFLLSSLWPFGEPFRNLPTDSGTGARFDYVLGSRFVAADGTIMSVDQAILLAPDQSDPEAAFDWARSQFKYVVLGIPGELASVVAIREMLILVLTTISIAGLAFVVVERRTPY